MFVVWHMFMNGKYIKHQIRQRVNEMTMHVVNRNTHCLLILYFSHKEVYIITLYRSKQHIIATECNLIISSGSGIYRLRTDGSSINVINWSRVPETDPNTFHFS